MSAWLREVALRENRVCKELNVVFCSDEVLLDMNRQFLGHDYLTDIITFDDSTPEAIFGELYIDVDTVRDNAAQYGVTPRREMLRVIVHGMLHLCGYKDKMPAEQKTMRAKEDLYLALFDEMSSPGK